MKKQILSLIIFALCACAFAVKLPDGKNVRSSAVTTYPSGALRTVKLNDYWDAEKEGLEISTPIGNMVVYGKICHYEDGSLKSCQPCRNDANKAIRVQTNMGELTEFSAGISRDTVSFYQSGALWSVCNARILYEAGKELPFMKEQVKNFMFNHYARSDGTIEMFAYEFLFYDSGRSDYAIVREAKLEDGECTLSTKAGDFILSGDVSFYRDGAIRKGARPKDKENGTVSTSLGDIFVQSNYNIELWQDGSIRECWTDDVIIETIYGTKVQIPKRGLLRFHKDGSVAAYTTTLQTEYKVGNRTYTANKGGWIIGPPETDNGLWLYFNTVVLKNDGTVESFLNVGEYGELSEEVSAFYPSGAIWKADGVWYSEDRNYIPDDTRHEITLKKTQTGV